VVDQMRRRRIAVLGISATVGREQNIETRGGRDDRLTAHRVIMAEECAGPEYRPAATRGDVHRR
jgi:hypothetical protein